MAWEPFVMKALKMAIDIMTVMSLLLPVLSARSRNKDIPAKKDSEGWLQGYVKSLAGEVIFYHSPQPDVNSALLVRTTDGEMSIEWETAAVPEEFQKGHATFVWIAGISHEDRRAFDLYVNGRKTLTFFSSAEKRWAVEGEDGSRLEFISTMEDGFGDMFGYMFLKLPSRSFQAGKSLALKVVGENAGSRTWYMTFQKSIEFSINFIPDQVLFKDSETGKTFQSLRTEINHMGPPTVVSIAVGGSLVFQAGLNLGFNTFSVPVPPTRRKVDVEVEARIGKGSPLKRTVQLGPVTKFDVYLLPHSHYDIGYTDLQVKVERDHWDYFEQAIHLARQTAAYPTGSRFKWNVEVLWAVDSYLRQAPEEKRQEFIEAVKNGWLGLQGLYANELTGLCGPEELFELVGLARSLNQKYGLAIDSAMITDIPGYTWGVVPALAQSGIKYFSSGPNHIPSFPDWGDRIGYTLKEWGDRPFYWVSPSGEEKVLVWVAGKGYSFFHDWIHGVLSKNKGIPLISYLNDLVKAGYPFDMVQLRYTTKGDNGPPDATLSDFVREWNEKFEAPKLLISTASELFSEFEHRFGGALPAVTGDFTGYWEDGAGSTALETALARHAADRLVQAEVLWTMLNPENFPARDFEQAWRNVLVFDEHTWGAHNSISEPDSDFVKGQWEVKQAFALAADRQSKDLLSRALPVRDDEDGPEKISAVDVYNTNSWVRSDLVVIPGEKPLWGDRVKDEKGDPQFSQRLSTGKLAVWVKDVPGLGSKRLYFESGSCHGGGHASAEGNELDNEFFHLVVNPGTGAIDRLTWKRTNTELVDTVRGDALNEYFYVPGKDPKKARRSGPVKISVKENGPLVASLQVESEAPGCRKLIREVTLIAGLEEVCLQNIVDKVPVREKEGVHFAFPFHVPEGTMRLDMSWAVVRPEADQLPGSCKNVIPVQRWVDISNQEYGIFWATLDAPMVEVGAITADIWDLDPSRSWIKKLEPSQTIFSYVMNNYWHTNYKADQQGPVTFRYVIKPHGPFDQAAAKRFGAEKSQPLIPAPAQKERPHAQSLFSVHPGAIILSRTKPVDGGNAWLVRLFNAGGRPEEVRIRFRKPPKAVYICSPSGEKRERLRGKFTIMIMMAALGIVTLRVEH